VIHIHTGVVWNTIDYAYYMLQNARMMASSPAALRFSVYCTDKRSHGFVSVSEEFAELGANVFKCTKHGLGMGSEQHGAVVNVMTKNFDPTCHNAVLDGDTVLLKPWWNVGVERALHDADVFGASFPDQTGDHLQFWYQGTPSISWLVFKQGTDVSAFDAMPQKEANLVIETPEQSELFGVPVGSMLARDTAWQLPAFVRDNGLKALGMRAVKPGNVFPPGAPFVEYHLGGEPFVAHMQRSLHHPFKMTPTSSAFYDACERYIGQLKT
jgi:hypothetical protein